MIVKEELVAGLQELIRIEEGLITLFTNFSKVLLKHTKDVTKDKKDKINESLSQLYQDSARHKEILDNLIKEIMLSNKNEY